VFSGKSKIQSPNYWHQVLSQFQNQAHDYEIVHWKRSDRFSHPDGIWYYKDGYVVCTEIDSLKKKETVTFHGREDFKKGLEDVLMRKTSL
jgi:hypothetical protein